MTVLLVWVWTMTRVRSVQLPGCLYTAQRRVNSPYHIPGLYDEIALCGQSYRDKRHVEGCFMLLLRKLRGASEKLRFVYMYSCRLLTRGTALRWSCSSPVATRHCCHQVLQSLRSSMGAIVNKASVEISFLFSGNKQYISPGLYKISLEETKPIMGNYTVPRMTTSNLPTGYIHTSGSTSYYRQQFTDSR